MLFHDFKHHYSAAYVSEPDAMDLLLHMPMIMEYSVWPGGGQEKLSCYTWVGDHHTEGTQSLSWVAYMTPMRRFSSFHRYCNA